MLVSKDEGIAMVAYVRNSENI